MLDNIILESSIIEVSELTSHPDYLQVKFVISDFLTNKNNVKLNRDTIEEWMYTLVSSPLLGKITKRFDSKEDFSSHEMKIVSYKGDDGKKHKKAVFDTSAFGVFTDVGIEQVDNVECIVAVARVWKRFENACKIIQERAETLKSSWEVAIEESTMVIENGVEVKIIDKGRFIGHCCLGSVVPPAYDRTAVLEVASEQEDELNTALIQDIQNIENLDVERSDIKNSTDKEVNMDKDKENVVETSTEQDSVVDNAEEKSDVKETETVESAKDTDKDTDNKSNDNTDDTDNNTDDENETESAKCGDNKKEKSETSEKSVDTETSALTERDLRKQIHKAFESYNKGTDTYGYPWLIFPTENIAWMECYPRESELDFVEIEYTVENETITITKSTPVRLVSSPREINQIISQKDNAISEMSAQVKKLTDEVAELKPYKDRVDEIEKAKKEAQLEKDRKELSEYAISSGYINADEIETSEEIKTMINDLNKVGIQSIISDRVVSALNKNKETESVETSQDNSKSEKDNIKINLSALDSDDTDKKINVNDAKSAIRKYIGR